MHPSCPLRDFDLISTNVADYHAPKPYILVLEFKFI
jgi:hypothetical protein